MYLDKRDNMGFNISPVLIVLLVILGAGGLVVCAAAVMRFYGSDTEDTNQLNRSVEQDRYMREVRERAWGKLPHYYVQKQQLTRGDLRNDGQSVRYVGACAAFLRNRLIFCSASNTTYG